MFTGKPLGELTLQVAPNGPLSTNYTFTSEVTIPLLEGGLLYRGAFFELTDNSSVNLLLFADNSALNSTLVEKISPFLYSITQYPPIAAPNIPTAQQIVIRSAPDNPQQFLGSVTQQLDPRSVQFSYKDIYEPITIGVITLVVVGTAALLCALNEVIGFYGNRECKKIRADFGFRWDQGMQWGCKVECIDPPSSESE